jgi:hypothetical protein
MTEQQREKAFPIHVELGRRANEGAIPEMSDGMANKSKNKKYYPTVYISDIAGLENLPEEGCILVDYKRRSLTINQRDDKTTCSVELELRTICMPDDYDGSDDLSDIVDDLASKSARKKDSDEEDDSDND